MKFILSDDEPGRGLRQAAQPDDPRATWRTTSTSRPSRSSRTSPRRSPSARTPYTLTFFEQINSPQGPWLQMLQRAYYTDDDLDTVIADGKDAMKDDRLPVVGDLSRGAAVAERRGPRSPAVRAAGRARPMPAIRWQPADGPSRRCMLATRRDKLIGLLYLAPGAAVRAGLHGLPARPDGLDVVPQLVADHAAEVHRARQLHAGRSTTTSSGCRSASRLKYTLLHHADPDGRRLPARAAGRANTPLRRFTRTVVFIPVVIGLGVSSLLWYWLFNPTFGLVNRALIDLGIIDQAVLWLGVDADTSTVGDHRARSSGR